MLGRLATFAMVFVAGCASTPEPARRPEVPVAKSVAEPSEADVLAASLPGVVLIVNHRPDNSIAYGAGILLDDSGHILTNMHVVANARSLGVMFHDAGRTSYIPQDGGLARYLFENEKAISSAILQRGEPVVDLAVLKVDAETAKYPRLPFRDDPVRVGERVMALGHPSETVWSFSAGLVSSTHSGVVQTDAAINHGNSGGPLIDTQGRVVGINTSRLVGDSQGIAFARPIGLAREIIAGTRGALEMDLSTPEKAFSSCTRAWEMGSASIGDCFDDATHLRLMKETPGRLAARLGLSGDALRGMRAMEQVEPSKWLTLQRKLLILGAKGRSQKERMREGMNEVGEVLAGTIPETDLKASLQKLTSDEGLQKLTQKGSPYAASIDKERFERTGMKLDSMNPDSVRELRRMGLRVDRIQEISDRAWIVVSGRNLDATAYSYSELYLRRGSRWLPAATAFADDLETLPPGFPRPLEDFESTIERAAAMMKAATDSKKAPPKPKTPAKKKPRSTAATTAR